MLGSWAPLFSHICAESTEKHQFRTRCMGTVELEQTNHTATAGLTTDCNGLISWRACSYQSTSPGLGLGLCEPMTGIFALTLCGLTAHNLSRKDEICVHVCCWQATPLSGKISHTPSAGMRMLSSQSELVTRAPASTQSKLQERSAHRTGAVVATTTLTCHSGPLSSWHTLRME